MNTISIDALQAMILIETTNLEKMKATASDFALARQQGRVLMLRDLILGIQGADALASSNAL